MLRIDISKQVLKFFRPLPAKQYRQVFNKILSLVENSKPPDSSPSSGISLEELTAIEKSAKILARYPTRGNNPPAHNHRLKQEAH